MQAKLLSDDELLQFIERDDVAAFEILYYRALLSVKPQCCIKRQEQQHTWIGQKMAADYTQKTMSDKEGILPAEGDWN